MLRVGVVVAVLAASLAPGAARADEVDPDAAPDGRPFWERVAHPHRARYDALLTEAYNAQVAQRLPDALAALERAIALEPREPDAYFYLGSLRGNVLRDWPACADVFARVLELDPAFEPRNEGIQSVALELGSCQVYAGRWEDGIASLRRALASPFEASDRHRIWWALGDAAMMLGRLDEAIDAYREALKARPRVAALQLALAVALDRAGDLPGAVEAAGRAAIYDPSPDLGGLGDIAWVLPEEKHYAYGLAHEVAGRRAKARFYFRAFVATTQTSPWLRRARAHLTALGAGAAAGDVELASSMPPADRGPITQAVLAVAPTFTRCLEGRPGTLFKVDLPLPPAAGARAKAGATPLPPAPVVKLHHALADAGPTSVPCLDQAAAAVRLPRGLGGHLSWATLWITAP